MFSLSISNSFTHSLPADSIEANTIRQVRGACYSWVSPTPSPAPTIIHTAPEVAALIGLKISDSNTVDFRDIFSGNRIYPDTKPFAMCYGGHQFGHWAGQLGDGRAINLFEVEHQQQRFMIQLKGAGKTPYSRTADGLAVLRSSIREYLCSEAMHHLGVPTTRALSLMSSGQEVLRDMLYNGQSAYEPGAIVCRVAPTFIRFGNFQILAAQQNLPVLKQLTNYTIEHFFPHLGKPSPETYIAFCTAVAHQTIDLIVHWERVGFVHGVMNTDNMSILGQTIDYGPYGWIDNYDKQWTPNTTDAAHKRYRFGNQAAVAVWNIYQLCNAIFPIIGSDARPLEIMLQSLEQYYHEKHQHMMLTKLGLPIHADTQHLIPELEELMELQQIDMTRFFRHLSLLQPDAIESFLAYIQADAYIPAIDIPRWTNWLQQYAHYLELYPNVNRQAAMQRVNPAYVLRNYMAQLAIDAAHEGNYQIIDELFTLLQNPYQEQTPHEKWFAKRPDWALSKVGCSMLSCSS